jgi:hypothetical protein
MSENPLIPKKGDSVGVSLDDQLENYLIATVSKSVGEDGFVYLDFDTEFAFDGDPYFHYSFFELNDDGGYRDPKSHRRVYGWTLNLIPKGKVKAA